LDHQSILNASSLSKLSLTKAAEKKKENTVLIPIQSFADCQGVAHHQAKLPTHVGKMESDTLSSVLARVVNRMGNVRTLFSTVKLVY
jgi:hypothetical protein